MKYFIASLLIFFLLPSSRAQKKLPAQIRYMDGLYMDIDQEYLDRHLDDSLIKIFGKNKAGLIIRGCSASNWPSSAYAALIQEDTTLTANYFSKLHAWRIFGFDKSVCILEVRPEDNRFLNDTSFHKPFYILYARRELLTMGSWSADSKPALASTEKKPAEKNNAALAKQKPASLSASEYSEEYTAEKGKIVTLRNAADRLIRKVDIISGFTSTYAEPNKWGWDEYLKELDKLKVAVDEYFQVFKSNSRAIMSPGNPYLTKINDWYANSRTQNEKIIKELEVLADVLSKSKSPSLYTFKTTFSIVISAAKRVYDYSY